ncbi:MAG: hypothetical protein ACRC5H_10420 [Treponemataceae bacterium]
MKDENNCKITTEDIIALLRKTRIVNSGKIDICDGKPSLVYRSHHVCLQKGNTADLFVTNGRGRISPFFSAALNDLGYKDQDYVKNKLRKTFDIQEGQLPQEETQVKEKVEDKQDPLHKIIKKRTNITTIYDRLKNFKDTEERSNDKIEKNKNNKVEICSELYALVESVFYWLLVKSNVPKNIGIDRLRSIAGKVENPNQLLKNFVIDIAKKIGFKIGESEANTFTVKKGAIEFMNDRQHDLFTVSSIALAIAENNPDYWLSQIAKKNPDFFIKMSALKPYRNKAMHENIVDISFEKIASFYDYINTLLDLFPLDIKNTKSENESLVQKMTKETADMKTVKKIEESLGFALKNAIPGPLFTTLRQLEKHRLDEKAIKIAVIKSQYQILEACFNTLINPLGEKGRASSKYSAAWGKNESNFFKTVKEEKIEATIRGHNISMQASFIAWLTTESIDVLRVFSRKFPNLLEDVSKIAHMRGHGELPDEKEILQLHNLPIPDCEDEVTKKVSEQLQKYNNFVIEFIKLLGTEGYFN